MLVKHRLLVIIFNLLLILGVASCSGSSSSDAEPVTVKLIAVNDFHGRLKVDRNPVDYGARVTVEDPSSPSGVTKLHAGGAAFLASLVNQLKGTNPNSIVVAAGDIIGASQPIAGLTSEEAAIDVMGQIGLEVTAVGNHEFDKGKDELLRLQNGGCNPSVLPQDRGTKTCVVNGSFSGAKFKYLAANVINNSTNQPLLQGTYTKKFGSATVGFVGLTLQDTPLSTSGATGLTFLNEATVINEKAQELRRNGADAVVVLIHQGGQTAAPYINDQSCPGLTGEITRIIPRLSNVDVVISGHTHQEYICRDASTGILLTSAGLYGRMVTDIDLRIIPGKGVVTKSARTLPVLNDLNTPSSVPAGYQILAADSATQAIIDIYDAATAGPLNEVRGYAAQTLSNCGRTESIEMPLGDVVADAYLASYNSTNPSSPAMVAFTNPGGVRANVTPAVGGAVTYSALYTVAPFGGSLIYKSLTGSQIKRLLEQQWEGTNCSAKRLPDSNICGRLLQPSGIRYTWDWSRGQGQANGSGSLLTSVEVNHSGTWRPIVDSDFYGVITNSFVATGGDNFSVFAEQEAAVDFGQTDLMALENYFMGYTSSAPLNLPSPRATCINCPPLSQRELSLCQ